MTAEAIRFEAHSGRPAGKTFPKVRPLIPSRQEPSTTTSLRFPISLTSTEPSQNTKGRRRTPLISTEVSEGNRESVDRLLEKYKPYFGETEYFIFETMVIDLAHGIMTERNQLRARLNNRRVPSSYEATRGYMSNISTILEREANCAIQEQRDPESGNTGYFFVKMETRAPAIPTNDTSHVTVSKDSHANLKSPNFPAKPKTSSFPARPSASPQTEIPHTPHQLSATEIVVVYGMLMNSPQFTQLIPPEERANLKNVIDDLPRVDLRGADIFALRRDIGAKLLDEMRSPKFARWVAESNPHVKAIIQLLKSLNHKDLTAAIHALPTQSQAITDRNKHAAARMRQPQ